MKGKCFSACNRGQRNNSDFYQTPHSMTEQLLENEKFDYNKMILEPACGKDAIVTVLSNKFHHVLKGDIKRKYNFFNEEVEYPYIITNPPFSLAYEFIQKSKEIAKEKFAMLLPLSYLHGQKRYESKIFSDSNYPLTKVYVFTRYPMLSNKIREDGKYTTGMQVYAWFIWENSESGYNDFNYRTIPQIKWIDNNKYILHKNKKRKKGEK